MKSNSPPPSSDITESLASSTGLTPPRKPNISYAAMIAQALMEAPDGRLALPEIYEWIITRYDYYRHANPAWKNSIRHNLSMNRAFGKAPPPSNPRHQSAYWQFAVPTRVKIGSTGKTTVSTKQPKRRRSSCGDLFVEGGEDRKDHVEKTLGKRRHSTVEIRPRLFPHLSPSCVPMEQILAPDPVKEPGNELKASPQLRDENALPSFSELFKQQPSWTPPPDDMETAFRFSHDPIMMAPVYDRSPSLQ
mgnify:FL=1